MSAAVRNRIEDVIVVGVELAQVVAVSQVELPLLAAGDDEMKMARDAGGIRQQQRRAGAEILVGTVQRS